MRWWRQALGHRVTQNAGALIVVQFVNYVAPFVVLVYLTRVLGLETYGVVAFSVGVTQFLAVVVDMGFTLAATQRISVAREKKDFVARLIGAVLCLKVAAWLVAAAGLAAYAATTSKYAAYSSIFVLSLLPLLGLSLQPVWFFSGIERMRFLGATLIIAKASFVGLILVLVRTEADYVWVPVADGMGQIIAAGIGLFLVYRVGYRIVWPSFRDLRYALRMTSGFFASRLAVTAYTSGGVLILGLLANPATVAIYALASQLYVAIQAVFAPVMQALNPYMAKERDLLLLRRVVTGCVAVAVAGGIIGHFVAPMLVARMFGPGWGAVLPVLDIFLVAVVVNVLCVLAGYPLAAALGRLDVANRSVVYGSVVYLALAFASVQAGIATPVVFASLMLGAELYVLLHRAFALLPSARQAYSLQAAGRAAL